MAGCAGSMLPTGLARISPEIQGKNRGKIARVQEPVCGRICGRMQARNFLPDSCSCVECSCVNGPAVGVQGTGIARVLATGPTGCQLRLCGTGHRRSPVHTAPRLPLPADHPCIKPQTEPDCRAGFPDRKRRDQGTGQVGVQGGAVHGVVPGLACGGVTGRTGPAHVNPVISHRHPDICADETRGRAIPPARAGADPRPGKNGVAPANRTGPVKPGPLTGSPDRRRDLPDLMRSAGAGIPRAGQPISGHGVSGHGDIRRQPPDLRNGGRTGARPVARRVFCRWPCRDSCGFF